MNKFYLLAVLWLLACPAIGQKLTSARADKYYAAYQFAAAAKAYEKVLRSEPGHAAAMTRLVQCYLRLENPARAQHWLNKALKAPLTEARHYKALAAVLAMAGRYAEAGQLYGLAAATDAESRQWQQAYQHLDAFYADSARYRVRKAPFNSAHSDFSPAFYDQGLVFSSSRSNKQKANPLDKNYSGFIDLFYASPQAAEPVAFSAQLNSAYHEGPLAFVPGQDTVYFTRSNGQRKSVFSQAGVNHLKIYVAVREKGKWRQLEALPLNKNEYSVGHPAWAGSHTLYFASDMPGGFGGTDLYKTVQAGGKWQAPVNLGPAINTSGDEMFPFVEEDGTLYFASSGHPGLGGLDIFAAPREGEGFGAVQSLGAPINSPGDDFGLIIKNNAGYYNSSYRSAHDDIYAFEVSRQRQVVVLAVDQQGKALTQVQLEISGPAGPVRQVALAHLPAVVALNFGEAGKLTLRKPGYQTAEVALAPAGFWRYKTQDTIRVVMRGPETLPGQKPVLVALRDEEGQVIPGGKVELTEAGSGARKVYEVSEQGLLSLTLATGKRYQLRGMKAGYHDRVLPLDSRRLSEILPNQELSLSLKAQEFFPTGQLGETISLAIEYDLDKADIRPSAAVILDKLVAYLRKYPDVKVELAAHTDTRGGSAYNQDLSQRRAESVVAYVSGKGIPADRMVPIGYGETRPKVAHAQTEAQHQVNRRTTVKITGTSRPAVAAKGSRHPYLVASPAARYFVVSGGFSSLQAARRKRSAIMPLAASSKIILPYEANKLFRVTVADFAAKEEALQALPQLKKRFGESIWILSY